MKLSINRTSEIRKVNETHSLDINIDVTYKAGSTEDARTIMFHAYGLIEWESSAQALRLYPFDKTKETWELVDTEDICYGFGDLPDERVNVTQHKDFVCLKPGERWTTIFTVSDIEYGFSYELVTGDMLRLWFKGCTVSW
ncbi:uncharacterized protein BDV14DRAFT_91434 [Aspergillus stella-maris]|uniref:uncharacterized protein n=1 Tax=Aspergillus stella-maris TaxID=1810926 RepID=UPI003CCD2A21